MVHSAYSILLYTIQYTSVPLGPIQSIWFYSVQLSLNRSFLPFRSTLANFGPIRSILPSSVHSVYFVSIQSNSIHCGLIRSHSVHCTYAVQLYPIRSTLVPFSPIQSIWFYSVQLSPIRSFLLISVHLCQLRSNSVHSSQFGPFGQLHFYSV